MQPRRIHDTMSINYKKELLDYIKKNISKGYSEESLKWALIKQGYSRSLLERAIEDTHKEVSKEVPVFHEKPRISYEIIDENDKPVTIKKPFWKRIFR